MTDSRNPVDLYVVSAQTGGEEAEAVAQQTTTAVAMVLGELQPEYGKLRTAVNDNLGTARCTQVSTKVVVDDPGRRAERVRTRLVDNATTLYLQRVDRPVTRAHAVAEVSSQRRLTADGCIFQAFAATGMAVEDVSRQIVANADAAATRSPESARTSHERLLDELQGRLERLDLSPLVAGVTRQFERLVADARGKAIQRLTAGHPFDAFTMVADAVCTCRNVVSECDTVETRQRARRDEAYGRANELIAQGSQAAEGAASRSSVFAWLHKLFLADAPDELAVPDGQAELGRRLGEAVNADLCTRVVLIVRDEALGAANALSSMDSELRQAFVAPIDALRRAAEDGAREVLADATAIARRLDGVYTACNDAVIADCLNALGPDDDTLITKLVVEPLLASGAAAGRVHEDVLLELAAKAAGQLCDKLRRQTLDELLAMVSAEVIEHVAATLSSVSPSLAFRAGHAEPHLGVRIAVPGGANSRLGQAVKRRNSQAQVTTSNDPLRAYAVCSTAPFRPRDLEGYARWKKEFDAVCDAGWGARLVTDLEFLQAGDGLVTAEQIDEWIVKGIAAGVIAPSIEPAAGTWYVLPPGERERPADVPAGRRHGRFGRARHGGRLGETAAQIRKAIGGRPELQERVDVSFGNLLAARGSSDVRRLAMSLISDGRLPSDDLTHAVRRVVQRLPDGPGPGSSAPASRPDDRLVVDLAAADYRSRSGAKRARLNGKQNGAADGDPIRA